MQRDAAGKEVVMDAGPVLIGVLVGDPPRPETVRSSDPNGGLLGVGDDVRVPTSIITT
jgi:hypothetical protein